MFPIERHHGIGKVRRVSLRRTALEAHERIAVDRERLTAVGVRGARGELFGAVGVGGVDDGAAK